MSNELKISTEELLKEVQQLDSRLLELAAERVAGRKRAELVDKMQAVLDAAGISLEENDD